IAGNGHLVELEGVGKSFGSNVVLDGIDLSIRRSEVVAVAGPSGSGKSTMLRCVNGLETVDAGEIRFDGRSITLAGKDIHRIRAEIGMVFQQFNLFPHRTVLQNITMAPVEVKGVTRAEAEGRARNLQERVAIARALAMDPKLMLFDEPTSALDPEMIREVLDVMRALARDGMTMIVVTHEMGFAREVCDRIVFLDEGRVVEEAPPEEFFSAAKSERAREFVDRIIH